MTTKKQPTFEIGERVTIAGLGKHYKPVIVLIEHGRATVKSDGLPGSERVFKLHDLEKISTTKRGGK